MMRLSTAQPAQKMTFGSGWVQLTPDACISTCGAFKLQRRFSRASLHRQIKTRSGSVQIFCNPTPQRLDRHTVLTGIQQIDDASFGVMPQGDFQGSVSNNLAQILRIPMRKRGLAAQGVFGVVDHFHHNRDGSVRSSNDAGIGHIHVASCQCRKRSEANEKAKNEQISVHNKRPRTTTK